MKKGRGRWATERSKDLFTIYILTALLAYQTFTNQQALKPKSKSVLQLYKEVAKAGSDNGVLRLNEHDMNQS